MRYSDEQLDKIKNQIDDQLDRYKKKVQDATDKARECLEEVEGELHTNPLSRLMHSIRWNFRENLVDLYTFHELIHVQNGFEKAVEYDEDEYSDTNESVNDYLNRKKRDFIDAVMFEDTLNYSTSPESNMDVSARYMSYRKVYNIINLY